MPPLALQTILSTGRIAFGTASLLAPNTILSHCHIVSRTAANMPIPGSTVSMTRMFGIRDAVVGALLYTADNPSAVQRALIAGVVVDGVDVLACVLAVWNGEMGMLGAEIVGGAAACFCGVGLWALMTLGPLGGGGLEGVGK